MTKRSFLVKALAGALVVLLPAITVPASAASTASLSGTVLSVDDSSPLGGATVHVGDSESGTIYTSAPTNPDGNFQLEQLPAGTYELAVEMNGGLYLVESLVSLAPGASQRVHLAVKASRSTATPGASIFAGVSTCSCASATESCTPTARASCTVI